MVVFRIGMRIASATLQRYLLKVTWIDLYTCQQFRQRESVCAYMCQILCYIFGMWTNLRIAGILFQ